METLIQSRMYEFSRNNNLINKEQAAYQWHKCTNDKIFQLTTSIIQTENRGRVHSTVFMDVEKAFDKVWHKGLIANLIENGFSDKIIRFIVSFLSNRKTFFVINGTSSAWIAMTLGVPQGSVLSALLFILFVSWIRGKNPPKLNPKHIRIPQHTTKLPANMSQFADDIKAYLLLLLLLLRQPLPNLVTMQNVGWEGVRLHEPNSTYLPVCTWAKRFGHRPNHPHPHR